MKVTQIKVGHENILISIEKPFTYSFVVTCHPL